MLASTSDHYTLCFLQNSQVFCVTEGWCQRPGSLGGPWLYESNRVLGHISGVLGFRYRVWYAGFRYLVTGSSEASQQCSQTVSPPDSDEYFHRQKKGV